jgi:hypothetical protein
LPELVLKAIRRGNHEEKRRPLAKHRGWKCWGDYMVDEQFIKRLGRSLRAGKIAMRSAIRYSARPLASLLASIFLPLVYFIFLKCPSGCNANSVSGCLSSHSLQVASLQLLLPINALGFNPQQAIWTYF